ncbi:hypothetical protein CANCADRAFT_139250 [Tortispora caseinolytica NRRL Y-17796]|uniref:Structural maintenance of chromosomes protein n=1 Tax=Tortispora caseinolytica NRRL Y-17796 TaxID=767744 RepID=A0A1E4TCA6_9ASCO|nr:hypothetical protein CANCADRAFT_139250 [Tortispora caseinolytica NRRL Y-17796]
MRVHEIIIDGFKSYSSRTTIKGWDSQFNCITGLNGSGKSNILDSICFVLGISSLTTVRAQSLQDLIYKQGHGGVTRASVTVVFDNSDPATCPPGMENDRQISVTRQIVLGGGSKYLINGKRATQEDVQRMFRSVQLNVNNPNFLVMQGQITKVLNMRPQDILSMIGEAAGTRQFENEVSKAQRELRKKQEKLEEIQQSIASDIDPRLEKYRNDRRKLADYRSTLARIELLERAVIAHDYVQYDEARNSVANDLQVRQEHLQSFTDTCTSLSQELERLKEELATAKEQQTIEDSRKKDIAPREKKLTELSNNLVRMKASLEMQKTNLEEEINSRDTYNSKISVTKPQFAEISKEFEMKKHKHEQLAQKLQRLTSTCAEQEDLIQSLQLGVSAKGAQNSGLQASLTDARTKATEAISNLDAVNVAISNLNSRISALQPKAARAKKTMSTEVLELDNLKAQRDHILEELKKLNYDPDEASSRKSRKAELQSIIHRLVSESERLKRRASGFDFSYKDPMPNFNRKKVKGMIGNLFTLLEDRSDAATALETCAGGRLFNVVTDDQETAKLLIEKGQLRRRFTFVPLTKINPYVIPRDKVERAKAIAPGKVELALDLIKFDASNKAALEFVFGSTLICSDPEIAKKVTFDPSIKCRSVTLDGDVYEPTGTLSGGSKSSTGGLLTHIQALNKVCNELNEAELEMKALNTIFEEQKSILEHANQLQQELELKEHEVSLRESALQKNSAASVILELENAEKEKEAKERELEDAMIQKDESEAAVKQIEDDMEQLKSNKSGKLQSMLERLENFKAEKLSVTEEIERGNKEFEALERENHQLSADIEELEQKLSESNATILQLREEISKSESDILESEEEKKHLETELNEMKAELNASNEMLLRLTKLEKEKVSALKAHELERKKVSNEVDEQRGKLEEYEHKIENIENEYEWVTQDKDMLGIEGSKYDFSQVDIGSARKEWKELKHKAGSLKGQVNEEVQSLISMWESRHRELKSRLKRVEKDQQKILRTIEEIESHKKEALENTWHRINDSFGPIFNDLLPGSHAELRPMEGKSLMDGLEVKVRLGEIWKESLTELSGGQRSLIALSLILAMLRFRPAPLYILDEIDAALDLSHTQNIGRMIKTHFKESQFIVVSLKEGFFSNANRIFRTKLVDGKSTVESSGQN